MPRNYQRKKPELVPVTEQQIERAKVLIEKGKSKRAAASAIGISESCLRKRLKLNTAATSMGRYKPTFNEVQETEFVAHCKQMDDRYFGLTINDLRRLAFEYASLNQIENRFDKTAKMAGRDWVECFLKRHPQLSLRQSAATSLARAIGFNKIQVERFYKNLKELYDKYKFQPSRIYNMDETGISTVPKKMPKVITTKGKKVVSKVVSAERGITVTAVCCMSATGHYVPPAFIYPRKRPRDDLLDGGPTQSICMVSDSGFINTELFINWLHHFKYFVHPTTADPVLLLLDNHSSHISLEAIKYARENNIIMLTLPPHGSHKLQPLDRCLYSPLKVKYSIECDKFMARHPGRGITQYHVARLFNEAYKVVATLGNAESGFKVTGIYPYNDDLFDETDFAPSFVTDQLNSDIELEESNQLITMNQPLTHEDQDPNIPTVGQSPRNDTIDQPMPANQQAEYVITAIQSGRDSVLSSLGNDFLNIEPSLNDNFSVDGSTPSPSIIDAILAESANFITDNMYNDTGTEIQKKPNEQNNEPSNFEPRSTIFKEPSVEAQEIAISSKKTVGNRLNEEESNHVSITQISPLPRMTEKKRGRRVAMKSQVITASPYKQELEEKKRKEEENKKRKTKQVSTLSLDAQPSTSGFKRKTCAPKKYKKAQVKKRQNPSSSKTTEKEYNCPLCQEKYLDPPTEEWIQCTLCLDWWHELCSSQENGVFVCDNCSDA